MKELHSDSEDFEVKKFIEEVHNNIYRLNPRIWESLQDLADEFHDRAMDTISESRRKYEW